MQPRVELDISLAHEISQGKQEALERVVNRHLGAVYRYVLRRLGPGQEGVAAAVAQDTFYRAMRRMKRYPRGEKTVPMRLWLLRLAGKQIARRKAKPVEFEDPNNKLAVLRLAIAGMREPEGAAVALALFEELPPHEVAGALGVSRHAAMRHLRKALRRINKTEAGETGDWSLNG